MVQPTRDNAHPQGPARPKHRGLVVTVIASGAAIVLAPLAGVGLTALSLRQAFARTATAPPSDKARVLATGISEAMNGTVFGVIAGLLALAVFLVALVMLLRKGEAHSPASRQQRTPSE